MRKVRAAYGQDMGATDWQPPRAASPQNSVAQVLRRGEITTAMVESSGGAKFDLRV